MGIVQGKITVTLTFKNIYGHQDESILLQNIPIMYQMNVGGDSMNKYFLQKNTHQGCWTQKF